ncbi:DEAD/DEAH box helicase family protein [Bifidobacterium callitrichos]|nr:DEAD/DEAH box helicase family protein [Bifidobacterium callitrichos]
MQRRKRETRPSTVPVDLNIAGKGRPYQIRAICDAIEQGQRRALLVMATGTGKTRVSAALTDVLMRANLVTNVLFLADRVTLVEQAASDYGEYLPNQSLCNMCGKKRDLTAPIVFSTYQTMVNAIDAQTDENGRQVFSPAHKVRSKIKFLQMIGRGTRRCDGLDCVDGLDGEYVDKRRFIIFDYCSNFAFFRTNPNTVDVSPADSLSEIVFKRKASIARTLQSAPYATDADMRAWRRELADDLHARVVELNDATAAVRLKRAAVEPFRERSRFDVISELDLHTLVEDVATLVHYDESDEDALRFDSLIYGLMLTRIKDESSKRDSRFFASRIRRSVSRLNDRMTLDPVLEQRELIERISSDSGYLVGADLKELECIRIALRSLIQYTVGEGGRRLIITDLSDSVTRRTEGEAFDMSEHYEDYKLKVNRYINEHLNEGVIGKIHRNEPIDSNDYSILQHIFVEQLGTYEDYKATYADSPFGLLVRRIAKLDHTAAEEAFADFINKHPMNPQQTAFLHMIVAYIEANGYLDPSDLGKPRFSRPRSFTQLFPGGLALDLIVCIRRVMDNAKVPDFSK